MVKYLVPVDAAGHTLRADFAAAYLRAQAAGMPAGGVDVFSRTLAEQKALKAAEAKRGVVTAPATENAPHVAGRAMDMHTTNPKTRAYDPSPAHVWLTEGGKGGSDPAKGEKLRGHKFGMYRTVPSERWHIGYLPEKDTTANADLDARLKALGYTGLTRAARVKAFQTAHDLIADGKAGPQTWYTLLTNPKPKPPRHAEPAKPAPKPTSRTAQVTVLVANCQSYDGAKSEKAWRARAQLMAKSNPDVILVQETTDPGRNVMCLELGTGWRYYSNGKSVALFVGPRVKTAGIKRTVSFKTAFGHGAVKMPLRVDGIGFDATSQHTRPGSVANNAQKDGDIAKGAKLTGTWPGIYGGDFARDNPALKGWQRVTPVTDSMDKAGIQTPDAIFTRGKVSVVGAKVIDPGKLSDHKWLVATLNISA